MFNIKIEENAGVAFLSALDALNKILDGEGNYRNYRDYIVNLHSCLELYFKKKLFNHNEFMIFDFKKYDKVIEKYEKAYKQGKEIFQYVADNNAELPNTVKFMDAICRLAYFYREEEFDSEYIRLLSNLNKLRNNIMHFEVVLEDDVFVALNNLFLKAFSYYNEYTEDMNGVEELEVDEEKISNINLSIRKAIVLDEFNKGLLHHLRDENDGGWMEDYLEFDFLAEELINSGIYQQNEKEKIINRLNIFDNAGFFEYGHAGGEYWDVGWFSLSDLCIKLLLEMGGER